MIEDKVIVLKREGDKFLFPTYERKMVNAPDGSPTKQFCRCMVKSYNPHSGKMILVIEAENVDEDSYRVSKVVNSSFLSERFIDEIFFIERLSLDPAMNEPVLKGAFHQDLTLSGSVKKDIELAVKHISFHDGKVSFEQYVQVVQRKITFEIYNPFIKKEYDSIKSYFPKALEITRFAITIQFEYQGDQILNPICCSQHISKINEQLFEHVEGMYITDYINKGTEEIYSLKDIAFEASKKTGSEDLRDADILLKRLITHERTKHYYHLRYLSDKHLAATFHLRVTGKPLSFIFLLTSGSDYYLVWETYLTEEATYIWKVPALSNSQLESELNKYIEKIKWLRGNNKMEYLRRKPEHFKRIEHEYGEEDLGFKKWKSQLQAFME